MRSVAWDLRGGPCARSTSTGQSARRCRSTRPRRRCAMVIDELHRDHHRGRRSSSACAKYADALRKISFMRFSSRTSRSNAFARWRSAVVRPPRSPLSRSACRTHFRSVSAVHPQLARNRLDRGPLGRVLSPVLADQLAPLALVLRGNTDSVVTWLHPLKEKALRQTRYGSLIECSGTFTTGCQRCRGGEGERENSPLAVHRLLLSEKELYRSLSGRGADGAVRGVRVRPACWSG